MQMRSHTRMPVALSYSRHVGAIGLVGEGLDGGLDLLAHGLGQGVGEFRQGVDDARVVVVAVARQQAGGQHQGDSLLQVEVDRR